MTDETTETENASAPAGTPEPVPSPGPARRRPRWAAPLAFAAGGSLTALALSTAFHTGAFDAFANTRPPAVAAASVPDPRVDRLLSLLVSERDCDSGCLLDLRTRADKSAALEQVLGQMQESATAAEQRAATLESEKAGLSEELARKVSELETAHQRQTVALEAEKASLADQIGRKTAELETERRNRNATLERLTAEQAARMKRETAELEAGYKRQLAMLEQRLAESGNAAPVAPPPRRERTAARKAEAPRPAAVAQAGAAPNRDRTAGAEASAKKWTVLGMTASTVVVATGSHKVVALAAGESLDGIRIDRIDLDRGIAETSAGVLAYRQ